MMLKLAIIRILGGNVPQNQVKHADGDADTADKQMYSRSLTGFRTTIR